MYVFRLSRSPPPPFPFPFQAIFPQTESLATSTERSPARSVCLLSFQTASVVGPVAQT